MGVVGSLSAINDENNAQTFNEQIASLHSSIKQVRLAAKKFNQGRVRKARHSKLTHANIRERLRRKVEELESRQNQLLSTVNQLRLYKQELEVVCQQRIPLQTCLS